MKKTIKVVMIDNKEYVIIDSKKYTSDKVEVKIKYNKIYTWCVVYKFQIKKIKIITKYVINEELGIRECELETSISTEIFDSLETSQCDNIYTIECTRKEYKEVIETIKRIINP